MKPRGSLLAALDGDDKTHKLQAAKVLLTQTTAGRRRGWGLGSSIVDEPDEVSRSRSSGWKTDGAGAQGRPMRCDRRKREMSDDEPIWRLWRSLALCAGCKPDAYFREPQPCARCGRPAHEHDTTLGIIYCGARCQELLNQHRALSRFEAAKHALAEAHLVDEVKEIRNLAIALQEYAKQANDTELLKQATDIRLRAERRWGEIYGVSQKAEGTRRDISVLSGAVRSRAPEEPETPTLKQMGVTFTQSAKWQKLAILKDAGISTQVASRCERLAEVRRLARRCDGGGPAEKDF